MEAPATAARPPGAVLALAVSITQTTYDCLRPYTFVGSLPAQPTSSQLLQQYKYDVAVLWPCLRAHGVDPGALPNRANYRLRQTGVSISPYGNLQFGPKDLPRVLAAARACPSRPAYLG